MCDRTMKDKEPDVQLGFIAFSRLVGCFCYGDVISGEDHLELDLTETQEKLFHTQ